MNCPKWTLASGDYDRVRALWDGSLKPEQFDLNVTLLSPDIIFSRMVNEGAFELSEMSLSTYVILKSRNRVPFIAIPVFPSRKFRHGDIYVRADSALHSLSQLRGKRVGVPEYQLTAFVWIRGLLQDEYGIAATDMSWRVGGLDVPGRKEKVPIQLPDAFDVRPIPATDTLNDLLLAGEIDAIFSPSAPKGFQTGEIRHLLPDYVKEERAFYQRTHVFPIIHTVVLRSDIYEAYPDAAWELYQLYQTAKDLCFKRYAARMALAVSIPWFDAAVDDAKSLMGRDFWAYGVKNNRKELLLFLRYMHQQGMIPDSFQPSPESLFARETQST